MDHQQKEQRTNAVSSLDIDTVYDLLSDSRRRTVLSLLLTHERELTANDLMKEIAQQEYDTSIEDIPGEEMTQIFASLHHNHIPRLADAGIIEHDRNRNIVAPTETLDQVASHLSELQD